MITNIDTEVHHAHVHEDAVRWEVGGGGGGYLLSASHFLSPAQLAFVNCTYANMQEW